MIQDLSEISQPTEGFLKRYRHRVKTLLSDGTRTDTYVVDYIDRAAHMRDAVGVIPFARTASDDPAETLILMRRQVRYAAFLATGAPLLCEMIAGVLELPETPEACAQRELWEEAGVEAELAHIHQLGRPFLVLPGTITERIFSTAAEVEEGVLRAAVENLPPGDGSAFEQGADLLTLTIGEALKAIAGKRSGATPDITSGPTELVLRRFYEALCEGAL